MVLCWSQQPRDRPSASQIVSIASAPEFTHLGDVVSLKHAASVSATTSVPLSHITDGLNGSELWLLCDNSRVDLLLATDRGWLQYHSFAMQNAPSAACTVGHTVWLGDCKGQVHAYAAGDCTKLFTYALEADSTMPSVAVQCMLYLPSLQRVACGLSNGRLFLVNSEILPASPTAGEGSFVMTELGSTTVLYSLCAVLKDQGKTCELWVGETQGRISIYTMRDCVVAGHDSVNHYQPAIDCVNVLNLVAGGGSVYSYVYPGCIVYQWDQASRTIVNKLDCSKLVPCSESLKSIAIEEHLSPGKCQVTNVAILNNEIYIGTTWGCLIIAERSTMRPITVFRPYEEDVRAVIPLAVCKNNADDKECTPLIATVGRGYRNLLSRYTDVAITSGMVVQSPLASPSVCLDTRQNNMYALLWRAEFWATS